MSRARRERRAAVRASDSALPVEGARVRDPHGVTWTVVAVHGGGAWGTLEAGSLRRTLRAERLEGWQVLR